MKIQIITLRIPADSDTFTEFNAEMADQQAIFAQITVFPHPEGSVMANHFGSPCNNGAVMKNDMRTLLAHIHTGHARTGEISAASDSGPISLEVEIIAENKRFLLSGCDLDTVSDENRQMPGGFPIEKAEIEYDRLEVIDSFDGG